MPETAANWSPFGDRGRDLPMTREGTTIAIAETPIAFVLQGNCRDGVYYKAAEDVLGLVLPKLVSEVARSETRRAFWLGPDMWLLLAPAAEAVEASQKLSVLTARFLHASFIETTETRVWLRLEGPAARETLMKLTARDLRDSAFPIGACIGALLGPMHALMERVGEDAYLIAGPTSSAEFLAAMMRDALAYA
jgi:sarcosine oxidase, subunit gamma